jgi:hypothetical protein
MYIPPAPTVSYIGRNVTTGDGFPFGNQTLTSGLKLVVVCCEFAGSPQASGVTLGGVSMTQAAQTGVFGGRSASVWFLETSLSGAQAISGTGGSGRAALDVYEVRGYQSSTPYRTATQINLSATTFITRSLETGTNTAVIGSGVAGFTTMTVSADIGPAPSVVTAAYESATSHFSWTQVPTVRGSTLYTIEGGVSDRITVALAAWR